MRVATVLFPSFTVETVVLVLAHAEFVRPVDHVAVCGSGCFWSKACGQELLPEGYWTALHGVGTIEDGC